MPPQAKQSDGTARLLSNILHPWVLMVPVVAAIAYQAIDEPIERLKWTLLTLIPAFTPPLLYARIRTSMLSTAESKPKITRSLVRDDPVQLLAMTAVFSIPAILILYLLDGPRDVLGIMVSLGLTMLVVALVNTVYRASFHLAMVTSLLTSLGLVFGGVALVTLPLIPLLALSRYRLGAHDPLQITVGFMIGIAASALVFLGLGLLS